MQRIVWVEGFEADVVGIIQRHAKPPPGQVAPPPSMKSITLFSCRMNRHLHRRPESAAASSR
jgi:hypothetical protein